MVLAVIVVVDVENVAADVVVEVDVNVEVDVVYDDVHAVDAYVVDVDDVAFVEDDSYVVLLENSSLVVL